MSRLFSIFLCLFSLNAAGSEIRILEDKTRELSVTGAYNLFKEGKTLALQGNGLNAGLTSSVFWMFVKRPDLDQKAHLVISNPHINRIELYTTNHGDPVHRLTTGDHLPFAKRPVRHPSLIFPLDQSGDQAVYIFRIDKHDESLQFNVELISREEIYRRTVNENLINGILGGILVIIIIFGLFLFISVGDKLYLYYVLYILMAALWVVTDKGYGYQFFWPESPYFASRARLLANFFFIIAMIQFMQAFIGQTRASKLFKPLKIIQVSNLMFSVLTLVVPYSMGQSNNIIFIFLIIHLLLDVSTVGLIVLSIAEKIREKNRQAWFYLVSVISLLAFILAEIFVQAGMTNSNLYFLRNYGVQTGIVVEAIILNFGLAHRFNQYKKQKEQILINANHQQQELTDQIVGIQENERRKIADQLHDEIGSMLSFISLQISSVIEHKDDHGVHIKLLKAGETLNSVASTIRNMSHALTPPAIDKYGFKNAITDLVQNIRQSGKLEAECIIVGFDDISSHHPLMLNDIYRIVRELCNNILKHSEATHCLVQLIEHDEAISILIEDNGDGLARDHILERTGMGLQAVHSKINYLKGFLEVTGKGTAGTLINIEIPVNHRIT